MVSFYTYPERSETYLVGDYDRHYSIASCPKRLGLKSPICKTFAARRASFTKLGFLAGFPTGTAND